MLKQHANEITVMTIFAIILILFFNPFHFWMPSTVHYTMLAGIVVIFAIIAGFILKENTRDEREEVHKMKAGRIGYMTGAAVLVIAIVVQGVYEMAVEPWIVIALFAMIVSRIGATLWSEWKN
ncbi:MAG: hypothetical protein COV70_01240 [Parcubacteria group bacterium CG11_big_fil_rev_8_21_14_0_20_39_22]|nr:MAG: hypothetical protein COV70_01240 [Parcubacteria group bacterium CG11_big_fil_rev_8_21_14_0_20_39_22]